MMQDIDFLPNRFREKHARRKLRILQTSILLVFALGVTAAAGGQMALRRSVKAELEDLLPRYARAMTRDAEIRDLNLRLRDANEIAELYSFLQHPWPRTQLVAAIVETLPSSIALNELTIASQPPPRSSGSTKSPRINTLVEDNLSPARRDLRDLREAYARQIATIDLSGRSRDATELHMFVARLDEHPLIQTAKLESLESRDAAGHATFVVRLVVRPGYGQSRSQPGAKLTTVE